MEKQEILKVIDEIIEKANEIKKLQKRIGASLINDVEDILIYSSDTLLKYAEIVGAEVIESGYGSPDTGNHRIGFFYNGYEFVTFVSPEELQKIREKVLPPTKVTEPNQNA